MRLRFDPDSDSDPEIPGCHTIFKAVCAKRGDPDFPSPEFRESSGWPEKRDVPFVRGLEFYFPAFAVIKPQVFVCIFIVGEQPGLGVI